MIGKRPRVTAVELEGKNLQSPHIVNCTTQEEYKTIKSECEEDVWVFNAFHPPDPTIWLLTVCFMCVCVCVCVCVIYVFVACLCIFVCFL